MTLRHIAIQVRNLLILFFLATLPITVISFGRRIFIDWGKMPEIIIQFLKGFGNGSSLYYLEGKRLLFFPKEVLDNFLASYFYLLTSGLIAMILGIIFGIWLWKSEKGLQTIIGFLGVIPDFVFVFLLQLLVIVIFQKTGVKVFKVASPTMEEPAIALPLITLFLLPFIYLVRSLSEKTYDVLTEDYIRTALSKGLRKRHIYMYHVTPNVLPCIKADLHKVASLMITNLFIVEYLFNIKGLSNMLFPVTGPYQYNLVILCFLTFFLLYLSIYYSLKMFLILLERILKHGATI